MDISLDLSNSSVQAEKPSSQVRDCHPGKRVPSTGWKTSLLSYNCSESTDQKTGKKFSDFQTQRKENKAFIAGLYLSLEVCLAVLPEFCVLLAHYS
jgi:hypothetical protein